MPERAPARAPVRPRPRAATGPATRSAARPAASAALPHADRALLRAIRLALRALADPARAAGQQAYMKSAMPYLGITSAALRATSKTVFTAHPLASYEAWHDTLLTLWRDAEFREERYAALCLAEPRAYVPFQRLSTVPLYHELIVSGAWWDYVDPIASHRIGHLLRTFPVPMTRTLRAWARDDDMWVRRTAILAQLTFKTDTDLSLLYDCIEPSIESREFFLRKAIGWALREYAYTDAAEVLRFVTTHRDRLSGLSKREALKTQLRDGTVAEVP